jgi:hypothetical protein
MKIHAFARGAAFAGLFLMLGACSSGNNGSSVPHGYVLSSVTEAELNTDKQKINDSETSLQTVGLKFQVATTDQSVTWDQDFKKDHDVKNPAAKPTDSISALDEYVKTANSYAKKYRRPYHLKHADGKSEIKSMEATERAQLKAKIALATAESAKLKQ